MKKIDWLQENSIVKFPEQEDLQDQPKKKKKKKKAKK
jgi:hypothetical protein